MATYVILSQISPDSLRDPKDFKKVAETVVARVEKDCPKVVFKASYATLGRFDFVDIVESDDPKQVEKASMIIRACGHSTTETLVATPWEEFLANL